MGGRRKITAGMVSGIIKLKVWVHCTACCTGVYHTPSTSVRPTLILQIVISLAIPIVIIIKNWKFLLWLLFEQWPGKYRENVRTCRRVGWDEGVWFKLHVLPWVLRGGRTVSWAKKARFAARIGQNLKLFGRGVANHAKATAGLVLTFLGEGVKYFVISAHCDFRTLCFAAWI